MKRSAVIMSLLLIPSCSGITCSQNRHRAIGYMNSGIKKFTDGLHAAALSDLKAAVTEDDSFALAHYNLAKVYQEMRRWDDAQRHLNRVVDLEPNVARHHYDLGQCYQNLARLDLAMQSYQKAISLNPMLFVAHYRLGTVYMSMDRPRDADASLRKAIEINSRFIKAFIKLGLLYLDYDYPDEALRVLQTGLTVNEGSAEAHNMVGNAYSMLRQYENGIASFKKALEIDRGLFDAMYNLGMTLAAAGKTREAEEMLDRFAKAAAGKQEVDQDYIRAAHEKIAELSGLGTGGTEAAPPTRLH